MAWFGEFGLCGPPSRGTALPRDRPKFRYFSTFRSHFRSLSLSLEVFSCNFGGVFECQDPQMCTFGLSTRAHLRVPALQTPKFHEKTPREREKKNEMGAGEGKKTRNFGLSTLRGRTLRGPTFSGFGAPPFGAPPFGAQQYPCPKSPMPQPNRA